LQFGAGGGVVCCRTRSTSDRTNRSRARVQERNGVVRGGIANGTQRHAKLSCAAGNHAVGITSGRCVASSVRRLQGEIARTDVVSAGVQWCVGQAVVGAVVIQVAVACVIKSEDPGAAVNGCGEIAALENVSAHQQGPANQIEVGAVVVQVLGAGTAEVEIGPAKIRPQKSVVGVDDKIATLRPKPRSIVLQLYGAAVAEVVAASGWGCADDCQRTSCDDLATVDKQGTAIEIEVGAVVLQILGSVVAEVVGAGGARKPRRHRAFKCCGTAGAVDDKGDA